MWDPQTWAALWHLLQHTQMSPAPGLAPLNSRCCPRCRLRVLGSLLQLGCTSPAGSPGLSGNSSSATQCEPQLLFLTPPRLQYHLGRLLHITTFGSQNEVLDEATSGIQLPCADSEETLPTRLCLSNAGLFLIPVNFSTPPE